MVPWVDLSFCFRIPGNTVFARHHLKVTDLGQTLSFYRLFFFSRLTCNNTNFSCDFSNNYTIAFSDLLYYFEKIFSLFDILF